MKITEILSAEHAIFLTVFNQIEKALADVTTVTEVHTFGKIIEGLLESHAETERNLAYAALDHVLAEQDQLDRMHQEHEEVDSSLRRVFAAKEFAAACRCLKQAIRASRNHFRHEETVVFPLLDRSLQNETLEQLGKGWSEQSCQAESVKFRGASGEDQSRAAVEDGTA